MILLKTWLENLPFIISDKSSQIMFKIVILSRIDIKNSFQKYCFSSPLGELCTVYLNRLYFIRPFQKTDSQDPATRSEIYAVQMMMDRRISELNSEVALEGGGEIQGP